MLLKNKNMVIYDAWIDIRSAGSPDSRPFMEALDQSHTQARSFIQKLEEDTMLHRLPMVADIAHVAVFLASEKAAAITGGTIDSTCGTTNGLNSNSKIYLLFK
ncbi:SDR family oxidoreductase [Olivibacter sp. SDN3]|uniref:SDR family oxidoreductase n=1 Tax=Olivibacter sp. SDN3 TaxID=2764720 RepID=UPI00165159CE|nr:SDR family oxidoreductase [Olivibacter sp. SDN3]QNL49568.1 SDR family oxidoreductase [Olivibacter sp. SDN3]